MGNSADVKRVRSFLGLANYYRKLIKNFSKVASPLSNLLGKEGQPLKWNEACANAFEEFKTLLSTAGVLKYPEFDKEFEVHTDASEFAIGGVLMQDGHPVAYESRKLTGSQLRWPTHENELYAIVHCLKSWRPENESFHGQYFFEIFRLEGASNSERVAVVRHHHFDGCRVDPQAGTR